MDKIVKVSTLLLVALALFPTYDAVGQAAITNLFINALTNRQDYFEGDTITLTGRVTDNIGNNVAGASVVVELRRPTGITVSTSFTTSAPDGSFRRDIVIPFVGDAKGNYTIWMGASKDGVTGYSFLSVIVTPRFTGGRGCVIATATYGSELAPQVQLLRKFRDGLLRTSAAGQGFMTAFDSYYYSFSPQAAGALSANGLDQLAAAVLYPLLAILSIAYGLFAALGVDNEISVIASGALAATLVGMVYATPLTFIGLRRRQTSMVVGWPATCSAIFSLLLLGTFYFAGGWLASLTTAWFVISLVALGGTLGRLLLERLRYRLAH